ncbi:A/G-specific adenine glycosylase [Planktosalinus lacus]|uniref:Adenine DNA glycosylase n=1 Tax=Planktosalinus lacus TaxID=1526573 RepID=A0A8J2VB77_9FLAO|nr:A/G-specific adenine glycosylase [Planktosalinus lacus]GGD96216.1 A/G-specific adenine glycosylase [Planktosalinus lacus]
MQEVIFVRIFTSMNFSKLLIDWYQLNKRALPWRKTTNPYAVWLSEIILQQTRIDQGLSYYEKFIETFPTVFDLAKADEETVLKLWQGLGYYSRARNLHHTAKFVVEHFNGTFPDNYKELKKLKGIGDYTASAIASICYDEPQAVVDGNVFRVLSRVFGIETPINTTQAAKEFKTLAQSLLDQTNPGEFNQALMEFGATQCKPQKPLCSGCIFKDHCIAFNTGKVTLLPIKTSKLKVRNRYFNYLVVVSANEKTLLEKRTQNGIWKNLYQFPLIEKENNSILNTAEIEDVFDITKIESVTLFNEKPIQHKLSHQHLHIRFWIVNTDMIPKDGYAISEINKYPVPVVIQNFIERFSF